MPGCPVNLSKPSNTSFGVLHFARTSRMLTVPVWSERAKLMLDIYQEEKYEGK
jgi:hypothetical protein